MTPDEQPRRRDLAQRITATVTAKLDSIIPGDGDLVVRVEAFREQFVIPAERLEHVLATFVDQKLVGRRGLSEYCLITLLGPIAVVAEGAANFGVDLAFNRP